MTAADIDELERQCGRDACDVRVRTPQLFELIRLARIGLEKEADMRVLARRAHRAGRRIGRGVADDSPLVNEDIDDLLASVRVRR